MNSPSRPVTLLKAALFAAFLSSPYYAIAQEKSAGSADYEKALNEYTNQDFDAAYIHLKNSLKEAPDYLPAKILMGKVLMISGYLREAETELVEALEEGADPNLVVDALGKTWLFLEKYDDILAARYRGLELQARTDWQVIVATAHLNMDNAGKAREIYLDALSSEPDSPRTLNAIASLELSEGNVRQAEQYLQRSLNSNNSDANSWRLMGDLQSQSNELNKAITSYETGYALDKENPILLRSLVAAYIQSEQSEKAKSLLETILEQTPGDPTASLLKAWLLASTDNPDQANKLLQDLSAELSSATNESLSNSPDLMYIRALSAYALNNFELASTYFSDYVTAVPDNVEAAKLFARTLLRLGQPKIALDVMKRHERELRNELEGGLLLGELYLSNNRNFKTVEIINRLSSKYPNDRQVKLLEVKTLVARGKFDQAIEELNNSPYLKTDLSFVLAKSMLLLQTGELEQADRVADKLLELSEDSEDFLNFKAAVLIRMKRWRDAEAFVDRALEKAPEHYSARFNKATVLSAFGHFTDAKTLLEALAKEQPNNLDTQIMLARAMAETGAQEEAITSLERVLDKDVDNRRAMELLSALYAKAKQYDRAARLVNSLIKLQSDSPRYLLQRIELYIATDNLERARSEISRVASRVQNDPLGLFEIAKLQLKTAQTSDAKTSIARATELAPDNLFLASEFIRIHLLDGDFKEAEKHLEKLSAEFKSGNAQVMLMAGDIAIAKQQLDEAATHYYQALDVAPRSQLALAKIYQMTLRGVALGRFEQTVGALVEKYPNDLFQRNLLADYLMNQDRFDLAEPHYIQLSENDRVPNRAAIFNNLANIYISKDLTKAADFVEKAIEIGPISAPLLDTQGWIMALRGDLEGALTVLRRAYAMDTKEPSIRYHLGYTLHKMGRMTEAKDELSQALASERTFTERERAAALLESI